MTTVEVASTAVLHQNGDSFSGGLHGSHGSDLTEFTSELHVRAQCRHMGLRTRYLSNVQNLGLTEASVPPEAMMHFPCFRFPPYFRQLIEVHAKFFRLCGQFYNFTFSQTIYRFSFAKIYDDLILLFPPAFANFPS